PRFGSVLAAHAIIEIPDPNRGRSTKTYGAQWLIAASSRGRNRGASARWISSTIRGAVCESRRQNYPAGRARRRALPQACRRARIDILQTFACGCALWRLVLFRGRSLSAVIWVLSRYSDPDRAGPCSNLP